MMSKGLSNYQIDDLFKEEENEDFKKNYMGTYSIDSITRHINFYKIIKRRNAKYLFAIFLTDKENEPGVHCTTLQFQKMRIEVNSKTTIVCNEILC